MIIHPAVALRLRDKGVSLAEIRRLTGLGNTDQELQHALAGLEARSILRGRPDGTGRVLTFRPRRRFSSERELVAS
ncbi:MAG TPA: hypothetical protein VNB06_00695 [Thermoanaerobaculia bacterium]|nr:hypothetical protein [Thermoanaerobaculia bacterium]